MGLRIFRAVRVGELTHYVPYLAAIVFLFVYFSRLENLKLLKGSGRFSIRRFWVVSPIISLTPLNHNNNKILDPGLARRISRELRRANTYPTFRPPV